MVLNRDDPRYEDLRRIDPSRVISYGMQVAADICPLRYQFGWEGTDAMYKTPIGELEVRTSLMGKPNLFNIGAAIGVAVALGVPPDAIARGIEQLRNVPGRFEPVSAGQPFRVIVDYAHTDDALEKVLKSAREITTGRVIVVFGCGGDRDRSKRPVMGAVAVREQRLCDRHIGQSAKRRSDRHHSGNRAGHEGCRARGRWSIAGTPSAWRFPGRRKATPF